jgi:glycosyltransferase involved in cell wall biosynthesis
MKVAILTESWGEPWNEGYKNLAKYIVEMINNTIDISVVPANSMRIPILERFDLIHIFNYSIPLHLFAYFARIRKPILKHIAKKELDVGIRPFTRTLFNIKFIWDALIVTTNILKEEVGRLTGDKPVFCLPPPIPTNYFKEFNKEECRRILGLEPKTIYVGYTGTLNKFRDLEVVIKALRLVDDERVKFAISLGNINPRRVIELKKVLMTNRVKLVRVKDVRLFYSSLDLLVYPVRREGAVEPPLTLLEAMSCGCIVVAYKHVITSQLIIEDRNGFLFSSAEDLSRVINKYTRGELDIEAVSRNARRTIVENYDASALYKPYLKVYENIITNER